MSCYHPLPGFQDRQGGPVSIGYHAGQQGDRLELACGRCVGCRLEKSRAWSIRIGHEASLWDSNLFLTLDYAPEFLPESLSLEYRDFQLFMKRLRKELSGVSEAPNGQRPIRFFVAGEYGEKYGRPHWHAILFNVDFKDKVRFFNGTFRSTMAEDFWGRGQVVIGDVTAQSAAYVAGYTQSKVYGRAAEDHYEDVVDTRTGEVTRRRSEFCVMSRRPGIGAWWYEKFARDLFPGDYAIQDGKKFKVPMYYWRKFQSDGDPSTVEDISEARFLRAMEVDRVENSERRRGEREEYALARVATYSQRDH